MSPQFVVSPNDLERGLGALQRAGNPLKLMGRLAGLGEAEWRSGVPTWAWMTVAFGVGIYVGAEHLPTIREKLGFR